MTAALQSTCLQRQLRTPDYPCSTLDAAPETVATADHVARRLSLTKADTLLHLGCGNGALSGHLLAQVSGFMGVGRSGALIARARTQWARPGLGFTIASVAGFVATTPAPWRFTAALCTGSFASLPEGDFLAVLRALFVRFTRLTRILIDLSAEDFTQAGTPSWKEAARLAALADAQGWTITPDAPPPAEAAPRLTALLLRTPAQPKPQRHRQARHDESRLSPNQRRYERLT